MPDFRDHFAFAARSYASYRPHYPPSLFDWLRSLTPRHQAAWDCGTGSGQAAVALARRFDQVVATDASLAQLANADRAPGVHYLAMKAEQCALASRSVDLVTVAQALHWFDHRRFFAEVDRALRPGGVLAVWSYGLLAVDPAIDPLLARFYEERLGAYWPAERVLVERGYAGIALPYPELAPPALAMEQSWSLGQLAGFLSTWSAVGRYRAATGVDPVPELVRELEPAWSPATTR
ncbi:MAG TPA: class I SAM-dependent methyltransferase, partial [Gemmatimonadaceae bacterium]|nr:class I SAM-dependent methyltransferase [Gemmatimonadaceae bacterium]